jgi:peptidylprolyl isomerase
MKQAQQGDTVKVHYKGTLDNGVEFDTSEGGDPLQFTIGDGAVIPGFETAIIGMKTNEAKTITIPSAEAYGERDPESVFSIERGRLPEDMEPEVGDQLQMTQEDGGIFVVQVTEINDKNVTLDANHPLAGEDLTFELKLVEIS